MRFGRQERIGGLCRRRRSVEPVGGASCSRRLGRDRLLDWEGVMLAVVGRSLLSREGVGSLVHLGEVRMLRMVNGLLGGYGLWDGSAYSWNQAVLGDVSSCLSCLLRKLPGFCLGGGENDMLSYISRSIQ